VAFGSDGAAPAPGRAPAVLSGIVGAGLRAEVGAPGGVRGEVGVGEPTGAEEVASFMVGEGVPGLVPEAVRNWIVGAGLGMPAVGAPGGLVGGAVPVAWGGSGEASLAVGDGVGCRASGALGGAGGAAGAPGGMLTAGISAEGVAGEASAAFKVTRTVSFIKGTLEVFFDSGIFEVCFEIGIRVDAVDGASSRLSFSLMRVDVGTY